MMTLAVSVGIIVALVAGLAVLWWAARRQGVQAERARILQTTITTERAIHDALGRDRADRRPGNVVRLRFRDRPGETAPDDRAPRR